MPTIEQSIEVELPISAVYDQWIQFESFPQLMGGGSRSSSRPAARRPGHGAVTSGGRRPPVTGDR